MKKIILSLVSALMLLSCSEPKRTSEPTIFVTIPPLKALVEEITAGDFKVKVLVPEGASPESYEPTTHQIASLNSADLILSTGLINFEQTLTQSIEDEERVVNLSEGIELIEGSCSHHHDGHHHSHGIDPHIWTSPRALHTIVRNIDNALHRIFPDSTKYCDKAKQVMARLTSLDGYCGSLLRSANVQAIMIYHPAYTYLVRDYGIEQITIEHDGKEPTPRQLTELVEKGRKLGIKRIFHQPQYSPDKLEAIATEIGAEVVMCNPLNEDIETEIRSVVEQIAKSHE